MKGYRYFFGCLPLRGVSRAVAARHSLPRGVLVKRANEITCMCTSAAKEDVRGNGMGRKENRV